MTTEMLKLLMQPLHDHFNFCFVAICFIVLDFLFGFSAAVANRCVDSSKMREGLWHKIGSIGLIMVADIIDGALLSGVDLGFTAPVMTGTCLYIIIMELVSVLENLVELNPELANNPLIGGLTSRLAKEEG